MTQMDLGDTQLIINECVREKLTLTQAAYVLATSYWETNRTMKPVEEAYWLDEAWRRKNLRYYPWHGRGYVQLTWESNYKRASKELGVDLVTDPRAAMQPENAVRVLVYGCQNGWFTGKKLSDYINASKRDYVNARRVVNGTDKAKAIAEIAKDYEIALSHQGYEERPKETGAFASFIAAILRLFRGGK